MCINITKYTRTSFITCKINNRFSSPWWRT